MTRQQTNHKQLKVLIIGCGNIAGKFDEGRELSTDLPYTHAGAYSRDGRFTLSACTDPDETRREAFCRAWNVPVSYRTLDEIAEYEAVFDVISICSPTGTHAHMIEKALSLKPKLIFCEKPVTSTLTETEAMVEMCNKAKIPLAVNYTRRWDPDIAHLQQAIEAGQWGELRSIVGIYNKGILNNGSHMMDLLNMLCGPINIVKVGNGVHDYFVDDPTIPVWLSNSSGVNMHLACADANDYALFELKLIFSLGVLSMEEGGMAWRERRVIDNEIFKGYKNIDAGIRRSGEYPQAMLRAVDNIYRHVQQGDELASTGETALVAQRLCEQIKQKSRIN